MYAFSQRYLFVMKEKTNINSIICALERFILFKIILLICNIYINGKY